MEAMEQVNFAQPGVLPWLHAEGEDAGLLDAGEVDLGEETGGEETGHEVEDAAGQDDSQQEEKIDGRKGSKEFREALKAWEATPEGQKYAKQARQDHFRAHEIATLEPGGLTAMREKYALLESVGGAEAITQMQERIAETDAVDAALAAGDPKALESLGPDFDPGLAKLTPQILDRVMRSDPEAYSAAILPHLMAGLVNSPMVGDLNRMIDVLQAPHLDEKAKLQHLTQLLGRIGQWFEANEKKAGSLRSGPGVDKQRTEFDQERSKFEQEQQTAHWNNKIAPQVSSYERTKLEELYKPYEGRLKLDAAAKADLFETFRAKMTAAGKADAAYLKQMEIYRKQKNPDPAVVANFVKAAINKHAKTVVEGAIKARYGRFLGAPKKAAAQTVAGARSSAADGGALPTIVSVKPSVDEIDYRKTSEEDQWKGIYTLKSGKRVKVQRREA